MAYTYYIGMALKHVVLGLLAERPDHGYALKHRISPGLPREHLINDGVLYPLLDKLEGDGLVEVSEREVGGRTRRVFAATESGRREFRRWLRSDEDEGDPPSYRLFIDQPLVKLLFAAELEPGEVRRKLVRQRRRENELLDALEELRAVAPPGDETELGRALYELEVGSHRERIAALERMLVAATAGRSARPARPAE
jgi:PadR family transcriptional regulator AphA